MKKYILVMDAGTTSIKSMIFDKDLNHLGSSIRKLDSIYSGPRIVEQDPEKTYRLIVETSKDVMAQLGISAEEIACASITNQRTSWLMWDGKTRKPLCNIITWQDSRGVDYIQELIVDNADFNERFPGYAAIIPPVFTPVVVGSTMKMDPGFAEAIKGENVKWGNVDTWLLYNLTDGKSFATSASTASNSTMMDNASFTWHMGLAEYMGMRAEMFPEVKEESAFYGTITADVFGAEIPVCSMVADQQAAMFSQGCFTQNVAKCTNGSGTFINVNIGEEHKSYGSFFTSIAWKLNGKIFYMFEGSSYTTGSSVEWAQNQLELFKDTDQLREDAGSVPDSGGVYFVPALGGMAATYGDFTARASFMGVGPGATRKHFARAVLESVAFSAVDVIRAFTDLGIDMKKLSVSGGVSQSDIVVQLMANLLDIEISRPASIEATGCGAAAFAAINMGWIRPDDMKDGMEASAVFKRDENFELDIKRFGMWKKAVDRSLKWLEHEV